MTEERTLENMHLMEVKDLMKSKPGLFRKIPKCFSIEERLDLEERGLMPMYEHFGQHGDVICSRVSTELGLYAASVGLEPFSPEVIDKVTIKWAEHLKRGEVASLTELLEEVQSTNQPYPGEEK